MVNAACSLLYRVPEEAPQEVADLVDHCIYEEPAGRPSMVEVLLCLETLTWNPPKWS